MTTTAAYSSKSFTTATGNQLYAQAWEVPEAKAAVAIVHGLGEHSSRYLHMADYFNQRGFSVYAYDHLGHGKSEGQPVYIDDFDILRDDCAQFIERTRQRAGDLPLFVFAHSMGGLVVTYLAVTQLPKLAGIILSGPLLVAGKGVSPMAIRAARLLGRITPKLGFQKLDSTFISTDPAVVQAYDADPLVFHGSIPARTGAELLRAMEVVRAGTQKINYPLLAVHGTDDKLVDVEATMQVYTRAGSEDKTMRLFDENFHELHNEPNKDEVLQLYADWIEERAAATSAEKVSHHKKRAATKKKTG